MPSLLKKNGELVMRGTALVTTLDSADCDCCGEVGANCCGWTAGTAPVNLFGSLAGGFHHIFSGTVSGTTGGWGNTGLCDAFGVGCGPTGFTLGYSGAACDTPFSFSTPLTVTSCSPFRAEAMINWDTTGCLCGGVQSGVGVLNGTFYVREIEAELP